jgi:hypothetical protein
MANQQNINTPEFNKAFVIKHFEEFVNNKNVSGISGLEQIQIVKKYNFKGFVL